MLYLGIDPGKHGGIAWFNDTTHLYGAVKMPETERDVWDVIRSASETDSVTAVIEAVASRPGSSAQAVFTFGRGYGFLRGCLIASLIPFDEVRPQKWQGAMGVLSGHKNNAAAIREHKNKLKAMAQQLCPDLKVTLDTADALLLCEYCRRLNCGALNKTA